MTQVIYKKSSLNGKNEKKKLADLLFKKKDKDILSLNGKNGHLDQENIKLQENNTFVGHDIHQNPNFPDFHLGKNQKTIQPPISNEKQDSFENIWDKSVDILNTYINVHKMSSIERIMDIHFDILKFLCTSREFLTEYLYKQTLLSIPCVPIHESIHNDYIICLEDNKKLKFLAPYILKKYNLSKEDYIKKWKLPSDYPFTAPSTSKQRKERMKTTKAWKYKK